MTSFNKDFFTFFNNAINLEIDGSGALYYAGSALTVGTADITLYAVWEIAYSITYDSNGLTSGTFTAN